MIRFLIVYIELFIFYIELTHLVPKFKKKKKKLTLNESHKILGVKLNFKFYTKLINLAQNLKTYIR